MGYIFAHGDCIACGKAFSFAPSKVPSIRVNGDKEPICRACFERWKVMHNKPDHPLDPGAYEPEESV